MAFTSADAGAERYDSIRALCAHAESDELTNATIDLPPYSKRGERYINSKIPTYPALTGESKDRANYIYMLWVAHLLCKTAMKGRDFRISDANKTEAEMDKIDWDSLADELAKEAEEELESLDTTTVTSVTSMLALSPSSYNPSTLLTQSIKQSVVT